MKYAHWCLVFACYCIATLGLFTMVLAGGAIAWLYRHGGWPSEVSRSNCWAFAAGRWLKNPRTTYIVVRRSLHAPVPHVFFAESIEALLIEEFKPVYPDKSWRGIVYAFWHKGRIRKGKGEE